MTTSAKSTAGALAKHGDRGSQLKLDNQLCFALYAASNHVTRLYQTLLTDLGLTYPQYLVLLVLWERGARSVGELGHALYLDSGTLTPLLKRMETAGLVSRQRDADDERRVIVSLTKSGEQLHAHALEIPAALECRVDLSPNELAVLRKQLQRLRQAITE